MPTAEEEPASPLDYVIMGLKVCTARSHNYRPLRSLLCRRVVDESRWTMNRKGLVLVVWRSDKASFALGHVFDFIPLSHSFEFWLTAPVCLFSSNCLGLCSHVCVWNQGRRAAKEKEEGIWARGTRRINKALSCVKEIGRFMLRKLHLVDCLLMCVVAVAIWMNGKFRCDCSSWYGLLICWTVQSELAARVAMELQNACWFVCLRNRFLHVGSPGRFSRWVGLGSVVCCNGWIWANTSTFFVSWFGDLFGFLDSCLMRYIEVVSLVYRLPDIEYHIIPNLCVRRTCSRLWRQWREPYVFQTRLAQNENDPTTYS